jgi:two-component system, LytTR family, response regulator
MILAAVVDDEILARQKLIQLLRLEADISVVGECASAAEAIELVKATSPDLLFLDIQMPGMDGFDAIAALSADGTIPLPRIIFTTAYDKYALKAFDLHAVDYLLKPFARDRLHDAVERARQQIKILQTAAENAKSRPSAEREYLERLVFKSRGKILFLLISEIYWITAEENYVRISTSKETHLLRDTMTNFEARLNPQVFLRIHRSAIVNLHFVKEIRTESGNGDSTVVMCNGQKLPLSRSYRARVAELLI